MKANTRIFGEVEIEDEKIITLEKGMIGFPTLNRFALIYDEEKNRRTHPLCGCSLWMTRILHSRS